MLVDKKPIGVYIHIPFCNGKCPYCDFYSVNPDSEIEERYINKIIKDMETYAQRTKLSADTLYIGGGTPNLLGCDNLSRLITKARQLFNIDNCCEITIEMNPTKNDGFDLHKLLIAGVNRLSIGLQSANDDELKMLGRRHNKDDAKNLIKRAKAAGFKNISLDLMLAIPNQTEENLKNSIRFCANANLDHISAYLLKIEPGTPYFKNINSLNLPSEEESCKLYLFACEQLGKAGFEQYEISNFSKHGKESRHNLKYWELDDYLGFGPSAHSFLNGKRFYYPPDVKGYINCKEPVTEENFGIKDNSEDEYAMLRLRLSCGLTDYDYIKKFNKTIPKEYFKRAEKFKKNNLVIITDNSISLTKEGFLLSNTIISNIISG